MGIKVLFLLIFWWSVRGWETSGVGSAKGTFEAMMGEVECYLPQEDFLSKLVCFVADAASVNFGDISGALTAIAQLVKWDVPRMQP